jgi:ppGpp synthetase/RelA/SpoT-type nucleotidyltranferase
MHDSITNQVVAFLDVRPQYERFAEQIANLLSTTLKYEAVRVHDIEHRAKTEYSFREKLTRPGKSYTDPLSEMPDLAGVRVILYDLDDMRSAEKLTRELFDIVEEESVDSLARLGVNEFGYQSTHMVVILPRNRSSLPEWRPLVGMRAEIQIRTVLQHAWASASHALQYKREQDVPLHLRRRLYRIAGLLELADEEFTSVKREHRALERHLVEEVQETGTLAAPLDVASVTTWLDTADEVKEFATAASKAGFDIDIENAASHIPGDLAEMARLAGIDTIQDLHRLLGRPTKEDRAYLRDLKQATSTPWGASPAFVILLTIFRRFPELISTEDFLELGWSPNIAKRVQDAATKHSPSSGGKPDIAD